MKKTDDLALSVGRLELNILSIVQSLDDEAYGTKVWEKLEQIENRSYSSGTVYTTIYRLVKKGLLKFSVGKPEPKKGGKARKYYHLTEKGKAAFTEYVERYMHLAMA